MPIRVLLVDDDRLVRDMYRTALSNAGFDVTVARDGQDAIDAMTRTLPAAVVLDVQMPRVDGLGVLTWMRDIARVDVPVIVLTNSGGRRTRKAAEKLGINSWLVKAETLPRRLVDVVREVARVRTL